ncbi:MAG: TraR/DksA C4-type zinc finger protein [Nitrospirae bacterium]|nr:TraR/DksA C4-type zinc finger protein [Nitrospirota bacterium]MCL5422928.1 TraR/DksA C4-type zinc finger protein [Nitrospirota bacterium]
MATKKKTVKTVKPARKVKVQKKVQKKTATEKTKRVSGPAKKPVRKKVKGKGPKATAKQVQQNKKKPAAKVKVRTVSRKTPPKTTRTTTPPLTPRKELLRKHLISKREEIVREAKNEIAKYIKGEASHVVETALDDGDWSVIDLSADINIRRLETHRERLLGIDEALMKLREGTYGVCEECGGEITPERLKVMPFAIYCRDCQEKREQLEKIAREEIIP